MPKYFIQQQKKTESINIPRNRQLQLENNPPFSSPPETDVHVNLWFSHIKTRINVNRPVCSQNKDKVI